MTEVTNVSVRYMRRIQVREYEPAEAEVTLSGVLAEGDTEYQKFMEDMIWTARAGVKTALTGKTTDPDAVAKEPAKETAQPAPKVEKAKVESADEFGDEPAKEPAKTEEAPKRSRGRPKKEALKEPPAATANAEPKEEKGSHLSGDPVDDMEDAGDKVPEFSIKNLQDFISPLVVGNKISKDDVKAILREHGANVSAETKTDEQRWAIRKDIEKKIAASAKPETKADEDEL